MESTENTGAAEGAAAAETATARMLRTVTAELQALRLQVDGTPDPEELAALRVKAQRFDELAAEVPRWRSELEAEQGRQQQVEAVEREARAAQDQARADRERLTAAFFASGGRPGFDDAFRELINNRISKADDGRLLIDGIDAEAFMRNVGRDDTAQGALLATCFQPNLGTGSGMSSSHPMGSRAKRGPDIHSMSKAQLRALAFGGE